MAYQTYITDALVCGSKNSNTSDRAYLLFAREAGMVWASARSVREERSKQRYALQDFSHLRATLIRGKSGWRIAGVEPIVNGYFTTETRETRTLLRNILKLVRRVMHGEDPHPEIFDDIVTTFNTCHAYKAEDLEGILSLRILYRLGYVPPDAVYDSLLSHAYAYEGASSYTNAQRTSTVAAIEAALHNSQL